MSDTGTQPHIDGDWTNHSPIRLSLVLVQLFLGTDCLFPCRWCFCLSFLWSSTAWQITFQVTVFLQSNKYVFFSCIQPITNIGFRNPHFCSCVLLSLSWGASISGPPGSFLSLAYDTFPSDDWIRLATDSSLVCPLTNPIVYQPCFFISLFAIFVFLI